MWSVLAGRPIRFVDIIGDKKSVFRDYFRQYAARTLYFRALLCPSLSKLEGHVPLPSVWLRRLCRRRFVYDTWNNGSRLDRVMVECILFMTHCLRLNLQLHTISLVRTCRISSFCTVAWQVARLLLTRRIARSLGDSWASCWFCGMVFGVGQLNYASQIWLKQTLVAVVTKICDF